jgi:hypothetical protein
MADNAYEDKTQSDTESENVTDDEEEHQEDGPPLQETEEDDEAYDPDISQQEVFVDEVDLLAEEEEEPCDYKLMDQIAEEDETEFDSQSHIVKSSRIKTTEYITKYEETRVLGWRSEQLRRGAPALIPADFKNVKGKFVFKDGKYPINTFDIAIKELEIGRLPAMIGRRLPNGEKVLIPVSKLKLI